MQASRLGTSRSAGRPPPRHITARIAAGCFPPEAVWHAPALPALFPGVLVAAVDRREARGRDLPPGQVGIAP
jgi:hypothetical protein